MSEMEQIGEALLKPGPPYFHLTTFSPSELWTFSWELRQKSPDDTAVRFLRGKKMLRVSGLFDEFAAALQFPNYFGENWNAFDECINDLEWLESNKYLIFLLDAQIILREEESSEFDLFCKIIGGAAEDFGRGLNYLNPQEPGPPKGFHVIFQVPASKLDALERRLIELSIKFESF